MIISLIAAIGPNRELGKDNKLLYHIPEDLKRFKKLTEGHAVIMGRKTFESIGKPLPKRLNIIITRNLSYKVEGCIVVHSLKEALRYAQSKREVEIFVIGGGQIYEQAIKMADKLYLTIVEPRLRQGYGGQCDTFFPDYSGFKKIVFDESHETEEYKFRFVELTK